MADKNSFLNWVGFKESESAAPSSVDRIRELETQLSDLRSRRDITSLSKEEFEILATETAMSMIKSAQARESKALASSERVMLESVRLSRDAIESAETKARSILSGAEARGRKYINVAEAEAQERLASAERDANSIFTEKRQEANVLSQTARRESERIITEATSEVSGYREWLSGVIAEAERLYRIQTQSLSAAEQAIAQGRARLDSAFARLADLQQRVNENLNTDHSVVPTAPKKVISQRTKPALDAPARKSATKKTDIKKNPAKRR